MGQVTAMKRGSTWQYRFEGAMIEGKRKRYSKGGFRTKAEALAAGTKAKAEYDATGALFSPSEMSLADYMDYWLESHIKGNMAYETYDAYESVIRLHIKPQLGGYKLASLTPAIVQQWVDKYLRDEKKLSAQSIANFTGVLSGALKYAVFPLQYLRTNPCSYLRLPKVVHNEEEKERIEFVLSSEQWKLVEEKMAGTDWLFPLQLAYHTGMRIGECCGLDLVKDVDFDTHTLSIRRQLRKNKDQWKYTPPKYNSVRQIYMGETLERLIRRAVTEKKKNMLKYGEYYTKTYRNKSGNVYELPASEKTDMEECWTICKENGIMINTETWKGISRTVKRRTKIEYFHPHCLRHTHGTILAEKGASPKTIMERLGHKNIAVTMERYVKNTDAMKEEAARLFESAL